MMGRAGRPQFDTHGVAVIMTQSQVIRSDENYKMTLTDANNKTTLYQYIEKRF